MGKDAAEAQNVAALHHGSLEEVGDSNGKIRAIEITVEMTAEMIGEGDMGVMYIGRSDIWTIDLAEMEEMAGTETSTALPVVTSVIERRHPKKKTPPKTRGTTRTRRQVQKCPQSLLPLLQRLRHRQLSSPCL
jgi:hypothetical protein